jgi:hypothetical protein
MSQHDCFDKNKVCFLDLHNDGRIKRHPEQKWASTPSEIPWTPIPKFSSRVILVQGIITPTISAQLTSCFSDVQPEFFASHSDNSHWYLTENVSQEAALPSVIAKADFVKFRFINARRFPCTNLDNVDGISIAYLDKLCVNSCLDEHCVNSCPGSAKTKRTALVVQQFSPKKQKVDDSTIMFAHTSASVWFKKQPDGNGWRGIDGHWFKLLYSKSNHR